MLIGFAIILAGLASLFWPKRRAQQIEKRIAEGDDRYFEEQRAYQSYPHLRSPKWIRVGGLITVLSGILVCVLSQLPGH